MPFEVKEAKGRVYRCEVCGRLTTNPILYKTCCMNKPVVFCSQACARKWISAWMRNQEQLMRGRGARLRGPGTRLRAGML